MPREWLSCLGGRWVLAGCPGACFLAGPAGSQEARLAETVAAVALAEIVEIVAGMIGAALAWAASALASETVVAAGLPHTATAAQELDRQALRDTPLGMGYMVQPL